MNNSLPKHMSKNPRRSPRTIDELRGRFSLRKDSHAELLLQAWPIKDAFYHYLNRCLSTQRTDPLELPEWKEVDEYLHEMLTRPRSKPLEKHIEDQCARLPFELLPHMALFVLRAESFLQSDEGRAFDVASKKYVSRHGSELEFDRRWRCTDLLGFLVHRHCPAGK